jgi:N-acetylmuramoyl-L-alanine amidase
VDPNCPALRITDPWRDEQLFLVGALDALRLCREGEYEELDAFRAMREFEWPGRRTDWQTREFVARTRLSSFPLVSLDDHKVVALIKRGIKNRDLVAVRKVDAATLAARPVDPSVAQLRLIREIESQTRGKLTEAGRQYRLLRDIDFEGFAERNSYYVVRQDEAKQVLDAMAKETGTPAELAVLFGKARDQLTRDWHAFTKPDGLILLRRAPVVRAPVADTGPAITPSQFRRMKLGWIIIEVVYESGDPWRGTLKLTMADGSEQSMQLPDDGVVNLENIEPGTVTVKFPEVSATIHTVAQGECLSSIAHAYGFPSYKSIYAHADNADLRAKRPNPNVIYPGDEIHIPDYKETPRSLATGQRHRIVMRCPSVKLRLRVRDSAGKSAAGCRYRLKVGELDEKNAVPASGIIEAVVPPSAKEGTLWVYWSGDDEPDPIQLAIGHLDPPDSPTGYQARLTNLGYRRGEFSGKPGRKTRLGLSDFQADEELTVTGGVDDATIQQLVKRHDQES